MELQQAFKNLKYLPHANWYGMDTVVFTLNDLGNHGLGSAKNTTQTIAVSVKSQNDPPKITIPANYYDAQEDTTLQIDGVNVFDVDSNGGLYSFRMYARNGYINVDTNLSTVAISNTTIAIEDTSVSPLYGGSVALQKVTAVDVIGPYFAVKAAISKLYYTSHTNWNGIDAITFLITDSGSNTEGKLSASADVLVGVKPVNDPTVVKVKDLYTIRQNTVSEALNLSVADVDSSGIVTIHLKVKHGFLHLAHSKAKGVSFATGSSKVKLMIFSGTTASINNALSNVRYESQDEWSGNETLLIAIDDSKTFNNFSTILNVQAINDPPTVVGPNEYGAIEKMWMSIGENISINDKDAGEGAIAALCVVSLGNLSLPYSDPQLLLERTEKKVSIFGPINNVNKALKAMRYYAPQYFAGKDTLIVNVNDRGFSGPGEAKADKFVMAITIEPVNDPQ